MVRQNKITGICASIGHSNSCCSRGTNCRTSDGNCECGDACHVLGECCSDVGSTRSKLLCNTPAIHNANMSNTKLILLYDIQYNTRAIAHRLSSDAAVKNV